MLKIFRTNNDTLEENVFTNKDDRHRKTKNWRQFIAIQILSIALVGLLVSYCSDPAIGQVKGNGNIETRILDVSDFNEVHVDFPSTVVVHVGGDFLVQMTTDENIFKPIGVKVREGRLSITQDKWIQATNGTSISIRMPEIVWAKTGGYGDFEIRDAVGERLQVRNEVGKFVISGMLESFDYESEQGNLDAQNLKSAEMNIKINGSGKALVAPIDVLNAEASNGGRIIYTTLTEQLFEKVQSGGRVMSIDEDEAYVSSLGVPVYVNLGVKNNRRGRLQTVVRGPENSRFSYGLPIGFQVTKKERWPVGTQVFEKKGGQEILLHTVRAEDEGRTISLFY